MASSATTCAETSAAQQATTVQCLILAAHGTLVADEPIVCRSRVRGTRSGRPLREALVLRDGPPVLCVLVATPEGRWHAEFTSRGVGREATRLLCAANGVQDFGEFAMNTLAACGLAVMLGWRFVLSQAGCEQTYAMMQAAEGLYRRRDGAKYLEHPVLACMALPVGAERLALPQEWAFMPPNALGRTLLQDMARVTGGLSVNIVRKWERQHGSLTEGVVSWPAWAPLARALSLGSWPSDLTVRFRRCATGHCSDAPVMPSARLLRFFSSLPCVDMFACRKTVRDVQYLWHLR